MVSQLYQYFVANAFADTRKKNILAVGGVGSVCGSADVLSRFLSVAGVLSNENDTAVLSRLETDGLFQFMSILYSNPCFANLIYIPGVPCRWHIQRTSE